MHSVIIILLLFFLPFVIAPFGASYFETPKVFLAEVIIDAFLLYYLLKNRLKLKDFDMRVLWLCTALILLTFIHLLIFHYPTSLFGNSYRLQGPFLLWHLLVFFLLSSRISIGKKISYIALTALVIHLVSTFVISPNQVGRSIGTLGEPNSLAATAIFLYPFVWFSKKINIFFKIAAVVILIVIILTSGSRSGIIAIAIQLLFVFLPYILRLNLGKIVYLCLILIFLSVGLIVFEKDYKYENRYQIFKASVMAGLKSPLIGHGFGNTEYALRPVFIEMNSTLKARVVDSSHNVFLDFFVQGGIAGLSILIMLIYYSIRKLVQEDKVMELAIFLGLISIMMFNPVSVSILLSFWWVLSQGFAKRT